MGKIYNTEAERKEARRVTHEKYRANNKDKIKKTNKNYYDKNTYELNKKNRLKSNKYYLSNKHKPTVYLLVNENYVGTTENINNRMRTHQKNNGRDVSKVEILGEFETREEALDLERQLHSEGYKGRHKSNVYR